MVNTLGASSGMLACQSANRSVRKVPISSITIMVNAKARIWPALWRLLRLMCCQAKRHTSGRLRPASCRRSTRISPCSPTSITSNSTLPPPITPALNARSPVNNHSNRVNAANATAVISQPASGTGVISRRSTRSGVTRANGIM